MSWIWTVLLLIVLTGIAFVIKGNWKFVVIPILASFMFSNVIVLIDYNIKTTDTEVWSGRVVDWKHKEEWDEYHPEVCSESNGVRSCTPAYTEHHKAENHIKTSDNGWIGVGRAPDGTKFNDKFPNNAEPLKEYWVYGTPTASTHLYKNKVQASYSIYRHDEIDLKKYPDLPDYPSGVTKYINIDRILGEVPNKAEALNTLAEINSDLNKSIPDPEKEGKKRSWKQVNLIFVNVGTDKTEDYGFALQDKWEGGNKNDFVVSFSTDSNGKVLWAYPFSWSEVELLKLEVRDYLLDKETIDDFVPIVNDIGKLVADKFERKQFADFNYLQIETSTAAKVIIFILNLIIGVVSIVMMLENRVTNRKYRSRYY